MFTREQLRLDEFIKATFTLLADARDLGEVMDEVVDADNTLTPTQIEMVNAVRPFLQAAVKAADELNAIVRANRHKLPIQ